MNHDTFIHHVGLDVDEHSYHDTIQASLEEGTGHYIFFKRFLFTRAKLSELISLHATVLGVIQFGIETDETKDKYVTAEEVHSETPKYSQEVEKIKSGAEMMTMSSTDTGYRSTERRRHKSETAASIGDAGATSAEWSYRTEQRQSSAFDNGAYAR